MNRPLFTLIFFGATIRKYRKVSNINSLFNYLKKDGYAWRSVNVYDSKTKTFIQQIKYNE